MGRVFRRLVTASLVLGLMALVGGFVAFVRTLDRYEIDPQVATDGIVALTGGSQRISDAAELLARGRARRLLITGVNMRTSRDQIAFVNPELKGFAECCVDLDYRARNTIGNAIETRRWAQRHGFQSLIVVTSNYHMPRTLVELWHVLPGVRLVPYPVITERVDADGWWRDPATARLLFVEYVKYVAAIVRTHIESDPEHSRMPIFAGGRKPALKGPISADQELD